MQQVSYARSTYVHEDQLVNFLLEEMRSHGSWGNDGRDLI